MVHKMCEQEDCKGEYKFGDKDGFGIVLASYPERYPHTCNVCGDGKTFLKVYPCIEYREVTP